MEIADTNIRVRAGDLPDPVMVITRPFAKKGTGVALWTGAGSKGVFGQVIVKTGKTIPSAAAAPTKPSAPLGKSVSLLDASNPQGGIRGKWQFNDAGLQLLDPEKPALHALSFPKAFDASRGYQLKIDYTLTGPSQSVVAVIPVGDRHCQVVMGGFGGKTDGIALIDGQPVSTNPTGVPSRIKTGKRQSLVIDVQPKASGRVSIETQLDSEPHLSWSGRITQLGLFRFWEIPDGTNGAVGAFDTTCIIHEAELRQ